MSHALQNDRVYQYMRDAALDSWRLLGGVA